MRSHSDAVNGGQDHAATPAWAQKSWTSAPTEWERALWPKDINRRLQKPQGTHTRTCATVACCAKWVSGRAVGGLCCYCTGPLGEGEITLIAHVLGGAVPTGLCLSHSGVKCTAKTICSTAQLCSCLWTKVKFGQWPKMRTKRKLSPGLKWLKCQPKSPVLLTLPWLIHTTQAVFLTLQTSQPFLPGSRAVPEKQLPLWAKTFPGNVLGHLQTCICSVLIQRYCSTSENKMFSPKHSLIIKQIKGQPNWIHKSKTCSCQSTAVISGMAGSLGHFTETKMYFLCRPN